MSKILDILQSQHRSNIGRIKSTKMEITMINRSHRAKVLAQFKAITIFSITKTGVIHFISGNVFGYTSKGNPLFCSSI